jgi:hypothetical protein
MIGRFKYSGQFDGLIAETLHKQGSQANYGAKASSLTRKGKGNGRGGIGSNLVKGQRSLTLTGTAAQELQASNREKRPTIYRV